MSNNYNLIKKLFIILISLILITSPSLSEKTERKSEE